MRTARLLLALPVLWIAAEGARAGEDRYAPVPPDLDAIVGSPGDEALAAASIQALDAAARPGEAPAGLESARSLLVLLDDVGVAHVARRLARGDAARAALPHLLAVLAAAEHPAVDALLERAAAEEAAEIRMAAAEGLGRGRTAGAAGVLARLARDPVPGVRAAALRALFALEGPAAEAEAAALPVDGRPDLAVRRLVLHRRRGDASAKVLALAGASWREGRTEDERMEAARLLCSGSGAVPPASAREVLEAFGDSKKPAHRRVAIEAALALLGHPDVGAEEKTALLDRAVGWLAAPVPVEATSAEEVPEDVLRVRLPDFGERIVPPVLSRLRAGRFHSPRDGVSLLRELGRDVGRPALRAVVSDERCDLAVRHAAGGALRTLGIGDEALARRLLPSGERSREERHFRRDIVAALGAEEASWAVDLLAEEVRRGDGDLPESAKDALEARPEPRAREFLVEELFRDPRPDSAQRRMKPLVEPADEEAFALIARAFADPRPLLRRTALHQFPDVASIRTDRGRRMVLDFASTAGEGAEPKQEIEATLYALMSVAPLEAAAFVRERWRRIESLDPRFADTALGMLQEARGPEVTRAVVDLVLEKTAGDVSASRTASGLAALRHRRGHRDEDVDAFFRRVLTGEDRAVARFAVRVMDRPARGDLVAELLPLLARARTEPETREVLQALRHQPHRPEVEEAAIALALDPLRETTVREGAARLLAGRCTPAARERLLGWLRSTRAGPGDPQVQRALAMAVGEEGGAATANALVEMLLAEILAEYADPSRLDPLAERADDMSDRAAALAAGVARTKDGPSMDRLLDLVFDPRFAVWARAALRENARRMAGVGSAAAAVRPPDWGAWLQSGAIHPVPPEILPLVEMAKTADDAVLATSLERVLSAARATGRLALFPDVYLERILQRLRDARTGHRPSASETFEKWIRRVEPVEGAADFSVETVRASVLASQGRFAEAIESRRRVVRIVARRGFDEAVPGLWRRERATLDALEGADLASRGLHAPARDAFRRALLRGPHDPQVLRTCALHRRLASFDLDAAEAEAVRAIVLERRASGERESLAAVEVLASVYLATGRAAEAVAFLEDHGDDMRGPKAEPFYVLRLAEAHLAAGHPDEARRLLAEIVLERWPELAETVRTAPWAAPLREGGALDALLAEAESRLLRGDD